MTDHPILFQPEMIGALIDGRKTQTRRLAWRIVSDVRGEAYLAAAKPTNIQAIRPGDLLWVRETWRTESRTYDDLSPSDMDADYPVIYEADAAWHLNKTVGRLRQSIHMPRWASRLTLSVIATRLERLQDISESDAAAEGVNPEFEVDLANFVRGNRLPLSTHRLGFKHLYNRIHGNKAWDVNPEVAVITFAVHKSNIDDLRRAVAE